MSLHERVGDRFDREARGFDAIYSGEKGFIGRTWDRLTRKNIHTRFVYTLEKLSPIEGKRILDAGCGSGRFAIEYAKRGAGYVVGVDLASGMLDIARRLANENGLDDKCAFVLEEIGTYKPDDKFDAVTALGFFDYIPDPVEVLSHLRELTVNKGILIASFPSLWAFRAPFRKLWRMKDGCYIRFYTKDQVREYSEKAGLEVRELMRDGPNYLLVASPSHSQNH